MKWFFENNILFNEDGFQFASIRYNGFFDRTPIIVCFEKKYLSEIKNYFYTTASMKSEVDILFARKKIWVNQYNISHQQLNENKITNGILKCASIFDVSNDLNIENDCYLIRKCHPFKLNYEILGKDIQRHLAIIVFCIYILNCASIRGE
jgi:hypothetical protein